MQSNSDPDSRRHRDYTNDGDRERNSEGVGQHSGEQSAGHVPEITPQAVDADRNASPGRMRDVADGGEKRRIDAAPSQRRVR